jgi:hypothetical protein
MFQKLALDYGKFLDYVKAKALPLHATKALGVRGSIAPTLLDVGTRWG